MKTTNTNKLIDFGTGNWTVYKFSMKGLQNKQIIMPLLRSKVVKAAMNTNVVVPVDIIEPKELKLG